MTEQPTTAARRGAAFAAVAVLSAACAAHGLPFTQATKPVPREGEALLYVFRQYAEPTAFGVTISIDGQELAKLNQGGYTAAVVKPGARKLKGAWGFTAAQKDATLDLDVSAGTTYYVVVTGVSRSMGTDPTGHWNVFKIGSGMHQVEPQSALEALAKCCQLQESAPKTY